MSKRRRPNPRRRHNRWALQQQAEQDADPDLDGDGLHPIIETQSDIRLINKVLATEDWDVPAAAKRRVPIELTRIALGVDRNGELDPTIDHKAQIRAAVCLDRMVRTNVAKYTAAIAALQRREAIDKGGVANNDANVQVVLYIPERGEIEDYEVRDEAVEDAVD